MIPKHICIVSRSTNWKYTLYCREAILLWLLDPFRWIIRSWGKREGRERRILLSFRYGHHYKEEREDQGISQRSLFGHKPQVGVSQAVKKLSLTTTPFMIGKSSQGSYFIEDKICPVKGCPSNRICLHFHFLLICSHSCVVDASFSSLPSSFPLLSPIPPFTAPLSLFSL